MTEMQTGNLGRSRPLRLWPGIVLAVLLLFVRFVLPVLVPDTAVFAIPASALLGLLILLWWLFLSRAPWSERLGAVVLMVMAFFAVRPFLHESIATAGMGFLYPINSIPMLSLALVVWAATTRHQPKRARWIAMTITLLLASGFWLLFRTGGITNTGDSDLAWRWSESPEERLLAQSGEASPSSDLESIAADSQPAWPGFRGSKRDSIVSGTRIATDWAASPPVELWRQPIGPAWSSFAVHDDVFYTQEQRGDFELVSCYRLTTGEPVWQHRDETRFWESNAGAGPRGTPTLFDGRVFSVGATGVLNVLHAEDGSVVWSRDAAADLAAALPTWGFSSSPWVTDSVVVISLQGTMGGYDLESGDLVWSSPDGGDGYSSPHFLTLDGVPQVLLASMAGVSSHTPADGMQLWNLDWPGGTRIVQPALTADGDLLISRGVTTGMRRVAVAKTGQGWSVEERWTTNRLKPYFSDFVIHEGHAYGFDGNIMSSIDVETGERNWKGGRYGSGQQILLADQDLLLVISEKGELALVEAVPDQFTELARFPVLEGKTWNHPVLVGHTLIVRNSEEMAAFRMAAKTGP